MGLLLLNFPWLPNVNIRDNLYDEEDVKQGQF